MADFKIYFPIENKLEGTVFENDSDDSGGATKFGITLQDVKTFYKDDSKIADYVKNMTSDEAATILKAMYWDYYRADEIPNQSLAMFLVDSRLNQGNIITRFIQQIVGVNTDAVFGPATFAAILSHNESDLFTQLYHARLIRYTNLIAQRPVLKKFYNGWINRLNAIKYQP